MSRRNRDSLRSRRRGLVARLKRKPKTLTRKQQFLFDRDLKMKKLQKKLDDQGKGIKIKKIKLTMEAKNELKRRNTKTRKDGIRTSRARN